LWGPSRLDVDDVGDTARLNALFDVANFSGVVVTPGGYIGVKVEMGDNDLDGDDVCGLPSSVWLEVGCENPSSRSASLRYRSFIT
jgi:hypothetical protein